MEQQTYEGTPSQLVEHLSGISETQTYRMTLTTETAEGGDIESLDSVLARMASRTPEEIDSARAIILAASPPPCELPEGKTLFDVIMGHLPGDESDEQINEALEKLS